MNSHEPRSPGFPVTFTQALARPLDLAPSGVYRAAEVTFSAGGLLHHRFTLTKQVGGLFSVALSRESLRVGVTHHSALRSPDFPQLSLRSSSSLCCSRTLWFERKNRKARALARAFERHHQRKLIRIAPGIADGFTRIQWFR